MRTTRGLYFGLVAVGIAVLLTAAPARLSAQQQRRSAGRLEGQVTVDDLLHEDDVPPRRRQGEPAEGREVPAAPRSAGAVRGSDAHHPRHPLTSVAPKAHASTVYLSQSRAEVEGIGGSRWTDHRRLRHK